MNSCSFGKITDLPHGSLFKMLSDAYSFDPRCAEAWSAQWREFDDFFFDHPAIAEKYGLVTLAEDSTPVGFSSWDPRKLPELVEVGHNCVLSAYKGRGIGILQMRETVRRIVRSNPKKIVVTTSALTVPAQRMYERAGFRNTGRRKCDLFSGDLIDYEILPDFFPV